MAADAVRGPRGRPGWADAALAAAGVALVLWASTWHGRSLGPDDVEGAEGKPGARVTTFRATTAVELCRVLDEVWAGFAAGRGVPAVAPAAFPPGMERLRVEARKRAFVRSVTPYVVEENLRIAAERRRLEEFAARLRRGEELDASAASHLEALRDRYRVTAGRGAAPAAVAEELLARVDEVPVPLALAQAALESAWGCSRMALEGNALFGQMVFGVQGIVPRERPAGATHSVARFVGLRESVRAYMVNLNSHPAYEKFRGLRARQREEGRELDSWLLAHGLRHYSEGRGAYVDTVRGLLKGRTLALAPDRLDEGPPGRGGDRLAGEGAMPLVLGAARGAPSGGEGV